MQISKDLIALALSILSATVLVASAFGGIKSQVDTTSYQVKNAVTEKEFKYYVDSTEKRLDRIEQKIDKLTTSLESRKK